MPDVLAPLPNPSQYLLDSSAYRAPQVDFSWLGNLPETALANQQRQYQFAALRLGMQQSQDLAKMLQDPSLMGGGMGGGQPLSGGGFRTSDETPAPTGDVGDRLAHAIFGNESNYGRDSRTSGRGAVGPMQITQGTFNANALPGERINNPDDNMRVGRRILDKYLKQYGDPARAMVAYFSGEGNVAPPGSSTPWKRNSNDGHWTVAQYVANGLAKMGGGAGSKYAQADNGQLNPKDRAAVDAMYGSTPAGTPTNIAMNTARSEGYGADGTSTAAPAPEEPVSDLPSGPPFAPNAVAGAASSKTFSGPQNIQLASASLGGGQPAQPSTVVTPTSSAEVAGNQGAAAGTVPPPQAFGGRPAAPITPAGWDNLAQAGAATTQPQPRGPQPVGRQPLPRIENDPDIQKLDQAITNLQRAQVAAGASFAPNKETIVKSIQDRVTALQAERTARYNTLKEQYAKQQETEEKGIAGREAAATETKKASDIEQDKLAQAQENKMYEGLSGAGASARANKPMLNLTQSMLNDPEMYTGALGETGALAYNRLKATFGDTKAALLQEGLKKITALSTLAQLNDQRFDLEKGGIEGGRVFKQSADLVQQASPQLGTTLAGNRFLVEIQQRTSDLADTLLQKADQWRTDHGGRLTGFNQEVKKYLDAHPVYSPQEIDHPELIGAHTIPASMYNDKTGKYNIPAVKAWASHMGLKSGDPVRIPADRTAYIHVP